MPLPESLAAEDMVAAFDRGDLVRQVSMRRTLFGLPRDLLPAAAGDGGLQRTGTGLSSTA